MELMKKIRVATEAAAERDGITVPDHPASGVIDTMIDLGRSSRLKGAGFYEYDESGRRQGLWSGLAETFPVAAQQIPFRDVQDRMLFVEAIETARCFEEGVVTSAAAANIGSIMGIGFPANTGGAAQFMTGWQRQDDDGAPTGEIGLAAFVARADELAEAYGDRFRPTAYLRDLAATGGSFPA
jgi:3-hydroxyacyl-CoA dehydrogenase/enoyl-CoA hydratase/3-hydroxybutyryl-CoA epimerase